MSGLEWLVALWCALCVGMAVSTVLEMAAKRNWEKAEKDARERLDACNVLLKAEWRFMDSRAKDQIRRQNPDLAAELDGVVH